MKETIYTIPVTEAFSEDCFCPFCSIYRRLEEEEIKYALGPAMMDPDYRAITNEKGFCLHHMKQLNTLPKALALSLVFQSHLDTMEALMSPEWQSEKKGLFSKSKGPSPAEEKIHAIEKINRSCAVCDKIAHTLDRYIDTFLYLVKTDSAFLELAAGKDGFCLPHYEKILAAAQKAFSPKDFDRVMPPLAKAQQRKFEALRAHAKDFIDSFDYQNAGKPCKAPQDTVHRLSCFLCGEFEPVKKVLKDI